MATADREHDDRAVQFTGRLALLVLLVQDHAAAVALYFMYYNFGRVHQSLRVTRRWKLAS